MMDTPLDAGHDPITRLHLAWLVMSSAEYPQLFLLHIRIQHLDQCGFRSSILDHCGADPDPAFYIKADPDPGFDDKN
jgi:hypothetical protein